MPAPNPTAWTLNNKPKKPFGWDPATAATFCEVYNRVSVWIDSNFPMSREMVMLIFFHETAFSNVPQVKGPASGFGQMQTRDAEKVFFFATLGDPVIPAKSKKGLPTIDPSDLAKHFATEESAIDTHCKFLLWLREKRGKGLDGMLNAQTGGFPNTRLIDVFKQAEPDLKHAVERRNRIDIINALNSARWSVPIDPATKQPSMDKNKPLEAHPIQLASYPDYWEYTLPQDDMMYGFRE